VRWLILRGLDLGLPYTCLSCVTGPFNRDIQLSFLQKALGSCAVVFLLNIWGRRPFVDPAREMGEVNKILEIFRSLENRYVGLFSFTSVDAQTVQVANERPSDVSSTTGSCSKYSYQIQ
jgi:hypothetical protein